MADVRQAILTYAKQQEGKPYAWGATGPYSFDCSGLVFAAEKAAGLNVSRSTSINEVRQGKQITRAAAAPGDLVYINGGGYEDHSGIYVGNGQMIDAPTQGQSVGVHKVPAAAQFWTPAGTAPATSSQAASLAQWVTNPLGGIASAVGGVASSAADAVSGVSIFGNWQSDLVSLGVKLTAAGIAGALVVVGAWQALHNGDQS